jgi:acetoin utilization deacetylase AcuC-like enzyme
VLKIAFSDKYLYQLPEGHRFPIAKYVLLKEQLLYDGTIKENQLIDPGIVDEDTITKIHTANYWTSLRDLSIGIKEVRKIGLPINELSILRARNTVAGTILASLQALESGIGFNIGGGTHHAYPGWGEGFCILNDIAIAAQYLLDQAKVRKVLVVDLDVHQGNGTAAIFTNKPSVFTFSMHGKDNYPLKKEKSDLDIPLETHTRDAEYLNILKPALSRVLYESLPDIVFYQAGVDVLEVDVLGKLSLSKAGCQQRDEIVLETCYLQQIPVVVTTGGGYASRLSDIVDAHSNTFRKGIEIFF